MIKGFVFDLDGVITDTAIYHYLAWKNLAHGLGIEIDDDFNEKLKGISRIDSLERILTYGNQQNNFTDAEKEKLAAGKNEHYVSLIKQIQPSALLPGIPKLLNDLKKSSMKMALASASKNGPAILEKLQIQDLFDVVVDPSTLCAGKPDPEIFSKAVEFLGILPGEAIGVEDAEAGIEAINAAGLFSVGVGNENALRFADYVVSSTAQLDLNTILDKAKNSPKCIIC